jgi:hypothetical protein
MASIVNGKAPTITVGVYYIMKELEGGAKPRTAISDEFDSFITSLIAVNWIESTRGVVSLTSLGRNNLPSVTARIEPLIARVLAAIGS